MKNVTDPYSQPAYSEMGVHGGIPAFNEMVVKSTAAYTVVTCRRLCLPAFVTW